MFKCDYCGLCCMNLRMSPLYSDLDRGDGICKYFNLNTKMCSIYRDRPEKCNVDKTYELYYKDKISKEQYYQLNYEVCGQLKKMEKKNVSSSVKK